MIDWKHVAEGDADMDGTSTDLMKLSAMLLGFVRDSFPINGVPNDVVEKTLNIQAGCEVLGEDIAQLGQLMCQKLAELDRRSNGVPRDHAAEARAKQEVEDHLRWKEKTAHRPDPEDM